MSEIEKMRAEIDDLKYRLSYLEGFVKKMAEGVRDIAVRTGEKPVIAAPDPFEDDDNHRP